jgi:hypothetical protein
MCKVGIFIFFPLFIVEVDSAINCHLLYKPIGQLCTFPFLDYLQPKSTANSASATTILLSALAIIEADEDSYGSLPTYAGHWPKWLPPPPPLSPSYDLSLILPLAFIINLKDLTQDELIKQLYAVKRIQETPGGGLTTKTPPENIALITSPDNRPGTPSKLECMSSMEISSQLHHPNSCLPPVYPCNKPNASDSKLTYTPEELHCLTGCRHF